MGQIGLRGTARRLFENLRLCLLCIVKKFDSTRTKLTEEIHFEVFPYGDSGDGIAAAARLSPGYCNTGGAASCCDRSSGAFRTAGIRNWGRSELGEQSGRKNPPACLSVCHDREPCKDG